MDLDKMFSYIKNGEHGIDKETSTRNLIKKRFWYKKDSEGLFVTLPPLGGHFYLNFFLRRESFKHGYSFLEYEFPKTILSSNWEITLNNFNKICDSVIKEIERLKKTYKFKKINIAGVSIGCVNTCMIANNNDLIDEIFLIIPGDIV